MAEVVTNIGREIENRRLRGEGGFPEPVFVGWGTDGTAAVRTNTALNAEAPEARVSGTSSVVTVTTTNDAWRLVATITATAARAIREVGTFDAASSGRLHIHATFDVINLSENDGIEFTIERQLT